jgi:hypothetical protein
MKRGTRGEVSLYVEAPPEKLYGLVSDIQRMGEWSPECRACHWIGDTTAPVVGARFKGTNRRGLVRWTTELQIVTANPGREFAFAKPRNDDAKWTYRFEPQADGTTVTESFEMQADLPRHIAFIERRILGIKDRKADLEEGMRETLRRLKTAAETPEKSGSPKEASS